MNMQTGEKSVSLDASLEHRSSGESLLSTCGERSLTEAERPSVLLDDIKVRAWRTFPGRNVFCCGGRCMLGADPEQLVVTNVMICAPVALFVARGHSSPLANSIVVAATVATLCLLWSVALSDPGVIPRRTWLIRARGDEASEESLRESLLPPGWRRFHDDESGLPTFTTKPMARQRGKFQNGARPAACLVRRARNTVPPAITASIASIITALGSGRA